MRCLSHRRLGRAVRTIDPSSQVSRHALFTIRGELAQPGTTSARATTRLPPLCR